MCSLYNDGGSDPDDYIASNECMIVTNELAKTWTEAVKEVW
jgi:hypothetical protein